MKYFKQLLVLAILSVAMLSSVSATVDIDASTNGILTVITGTVLDETGAPLEGVDVDAYCRHDGVENHVESVETVVSGSYSASVLNWGPTTCVEGDKAWVVVSYQGNDHKSSEVTVSRISGIMDYARIPGLGVPEFSTVTMGLAVMGTMAGLFVLRKRQ